MKNNFLLHHDALSVIDELTDEQAGQLIRAIYEYSKFLSNPDKAKKPSGLSGLMSIVLHPFKMQIDRDFAAYKRKCEANARNGKKGGRPNNNKAQQNPTKAKKADNDNDNDKDNEDIYIGNPKKFVKPNISEVRAYSDEYAHVHNLQPINAQAWLDYYEANGWRVGRNSMKDWKASVRTWYKDAKPAAVHPANTLGGYRF